MFFNVDAIEALVDLRRDWRLVRDELSAAGDAGFRFWRERHLFDHEWRTLILFDGYKGAVPRRIDENCAAFPETCRILERLPGLLTAGFSRLGPGTRIRPHRGCDHHVLRIHLGLDTSESCAISVRGQVRRWRAGELLAFDDTYLHEAWNLGRTPRTILLVDLRLTGRPETLFATAVQRLSWRDRLRWAGQWVRFVAGRLRA